MAAVQGRSTLMEPEPAIDMDLTGDEDVMDGFAGPPAAPNAIEGNVFLGGKYYQH